MSIGPPYERCEALCSCNHCTETPLGPRKAAQGQRHTQAETKPTASTVHITQLEARDLALGRGSLPVCTEAHTAGGVQTAAVYVWWACFKKDFLQGRGWGCQTLGYHEHTVYPEGVHVPFS